MVTRHWAKSTKLDAEGSLGLRQGSVEVTLGPGVHSRTSPDKYPHMTSVTKLKSSCLFFQKVTQLYGLWLLFL